MTPYIIRDDKGRRCAIDALFALDLSKPWAVTIEPHKERRSLNQNSLMWKWIGIIAQETGNDPDVVHETLKQKFLVPEEISVMGEKMLYRSTARLDTKGMTEYLDKVYAFSHQDLGISLPVPEDETGRAA